MRSISSGSVTPMEEEEDDGELFAPTCYRLEELVDSLKVPLSCQHFAEVRRRGFACA